MTCDATGLLLTAALRAVLTLPDDVVAALTREGATVPAYVTSLLHKRTTEQIELLEEGHTDAQP